MTSTRAQRGSRLRRARSGANTERGATARSLLVARALLLTERGFDGLARVVFEVADAGLQVVHGLAAFAHAIERATLLIFTQLVGAAAGDEPEREGRLTRSIFFMSVLIFEGSDGTARRTLLVSCLFIKLSICPFFVSTENFPLEALVKKRAFCTLLSPHSRRPAAAASTWTLSTDTVRA